MAKRVQETNVGVPKRRRMDARRQVTLRNDTLQLLTKLGVKSCPNITIAFSTIPSRNKVAIAIRLPVYNNETQTEGHLVDSAAQTEYNAVLATISRYFESLQATSRLPQCH